jgi:hypothetical protein
VAEGHEIAGGHSPVVRHREPDWPLSSRIESFMAQNATYASKDDAALTGSPTLNGVPVATTDDAFINSIIFGG